MNEAFKIEAGVSLQCRICGKRTTVPALKVGQGGSCECCGAVLVPGSGDYAAKAVILRMAVKRNDVKID